LTGYEARYFDSEPILAHVMLVEASAVGAWAREHRERHIANLTTLIEEYAGQPEAGHAHTHVTAGVMASLLGVLHKELVDGRREPLIALLGPLMGLVTAHYLDRRGVLREIRHGDEMAEQLLVRQRGKQPARCEVTVPRFLLDPRAHRARACVLRLAEHHGASNRQLARAVGVARDDQISTLLSRLTREGLLCKRQARPGGPNAWWLSPYGLQVACALRASR
jgi:hypothetical protein